MPLRALVSPAPAAPGGEASEGGSSPPSYLVRRDLLRETLQLFAAHLHLFTLITLTVWLPSHVVINYLDFFTGRPPGSTEAAARGIRVFLVVEAVFGPLVGAATLAALARIRSGEPASYGQAMLDGLAVWPRIFMARLVAGAIVLVGFVALVVPGLILLVRVSFVDALVVLEGLPLGAALRRSNALTAGRRSAIFWTGSVLFVGVFSLATILSVLAGAAEHFVAQVLVDCAIAVTQTVFTIALFLFYREARAAPAPTPPV
jgi:hypothetical protein